MSDILRQANGKPWLDDNGNKVPRKCPKCGADVGLYIEGEPVFLCKGSERHYIGTLMFPNLGEETEK